MDHSQLLKDAWDSVTQKDSSKEAEQCAERGYAQTRTDGVWRAQVDHQAHTLGVLSV